MVRLDGLRCALFEVSLFDRRGDVQQPGKVDSYLDPQEPSVWNKLHSSVSVD